MPHKMGLEKVTENYKKRKSLIIRYSMKSGRLWHSRNYDFFLWEKLFQCSFIKKMLIIQPIPCHFSLSIPPWNHQKSYGFLMFLGGKWHEIINPKLSQFLVIFSVDCFFTMHSPFQSIYQNLFKCWKQWYNSFMTEVPISWLSSIW